MDNNEKISAQKAIASTLHKEEKALATMTAKQAKQWQLDRFAASIAHHRTMLAVIEGQPIPRDQAEAALAAIGGYVDAVEKILPKFAPGTPQHTLGLRRIAGYETAAELLRKEVEPC